MPTQHDSLRRRTEQHKPKNTKSKKDDKNIYSAMELVSDYLSERFKDEPQMKDYSIKFVKQLSIEFMISVIKSTKVRYEFDTNYLDRKIIPDGGALILVNKRTKISKPIIIAEVKRQGTNKQRMKEGKDRQATGNAIERLGKNLTGIKTMMNHEKVTPFICFGWGDDFAEDEKTVLSKISVLNEFYPINKTYVFKKEGDSNHNSFAPVSMYFREEQWTIKEMFNIMKEIAETTLRFYLF